MGFVFILKHIYKFIDSKGYEQFEDSFLGIYASEEDVEKAIDRYLILPGFDHYPRKCFVVEKRKVDKDTGWTEGFIKSYEAAEVEEVAEIYDKNSGGFDVSSWLKGKIPYCDETPKEFADRMMDEKYGKGNWNLDEGLREEYNDIRVWRETSFE